MSEGERKGVTPETTASSVGSLLSNVAPPSGLPTFITSAVPASQLPPSMQARVPVAQGSNPGPATVPASSVLPAATPAPPQPASPERFSAAIPPSKGEPLAAIRSPDDTPQSPVSSAESAAETEQIGDVMPGSGLLTWVRGAVAGGGAGAGGWLHRVAEKAKSSVDTMITTLDPQMKEYLNSGGDVRLVVACDAEWEVAPVREAFQHVFGKATVLGMGVETGDAVAAQAVGPGAAFAAAKHRLATLRADHQQLNNNVPVLALESFLLETPGDRWLEATLLVLSQPSLGVELQLVSQGTALPDAVVPALRAASVGYKHAATGFAATAAALIADSLQVSPQDWHESLTGVSRRETLRLAARALAGSYNKLLRLSAGAPPS